VWVRAVVGCQPGSRPLSCALEKGTATLSDQQGACVNPPPSTGASYCPQADVENATEQMERALRTVSVGISVGVNLLPEPKASQVLVFMVGVAGFEPAALREAPAPPGEEGKMEAPTMTRPCRAGHGRWKSRFLPGAPW